MKPLYLEMSAFGSYGNLEVVDFASMNQGIFLITGDTGAGKTTIFDAMMYALYDETSGGRRDGSMMRSQYAADGTQTYVKFVFSYRGQEYKIRRNPEYLRPGKRKNADGSMRMVKEASGVELTLPDGSSFPGTKREVDKKIQEIIGLSGEQFRQVAMIAQGDFLKLLHAPSSERKQIFSRIFHTKIYARIQDQLRNQTKNLQDQIQESVAGCRRELVSVRCQDESACGERWRTLQENPEFSMEETLELLREIVSEDGERKASLEKERKACREQRESLEALLHCREKLEQSESRCRENDEKIKALDEWLVSQSGVLEELRKIHEAAKAALLKEEGELSARITRIKDSLDHYETLAIRQKEYKKVERQYLQGEKTKEQNRKKQEQTQKKKIGIQEKLEKLKDLPVRRLEAENLLAKFETQYKELLELKKQLNQLNRIEEEVQRAGAYYQQSQKKAQKASADYDIAYEQFFREQAGILAGELKPGIPCPVCGSMEHPSPAPLSENAPTQEEVNALRQKREEAEQEREKAHITYMERKQRYETMWEQLCRLGNCLLEVENYQPDERGCVKVDKTVEIVDKYLDKSREDVDKIRQQEAKEKELRKELAENEEITEKLAQELEQSVKQQQEDMVQLSSLEKEIQLLQSGLTFEDEKKARQELRQVEKLRGQLQRNVDKSEEDYSKKEKEIHLRVGQKKAGEEFQKQLQKESEKAQNSYQRQWEICREQYVNPEKEKTDSRLWQEEEITAEDLEEKLRLLRKQDKNLEKSYLKLYNTAQNNRQALQNLTVYRESLQELQKTYTIYNDLSRTANGTLTGSIKVDFETYVQRQYFKRIIGAANRRLVMMNNQQFILQCREIKKLGTQGQVGLDLDVYHLVNDSTRDVKTLSGGESFMSALAMALGLADIIQNEAGAIRLETMFVDEGFGSLDDEARAQAISVLLELADDSRLVGIVSHVNELKEQIDHKLLVTKDSHGSHVKWAEK